MKKGTIKKLDEVRKEIQFYRDNEKVDIKLLCAYDVQFIEACIQSLEELLYNKNEHLQESILKYNTYACKYKMIVDLTRTTNKSICKYIDKLEDRLRQLNIMLKANIKELDHTLIRN